jgi:thiol-disulfide isomerase/thioredoxin
MKARVLRRPAPALGLALLSFHLSDVHAQEGGKEKAAIGVVSIAGIRLPDLDGNVVDLGGYLGKGPVLLDFWATWCKPCTVALPELNRLHTDLAPRGLQIIGINEDGQRNASKVKPFVKTQGFKFPVVLDLNREAQSRLNVAVLPTTLLLDAEGKLVHTSFGYRPGEVDALREKIEPFLAPPRE